VTGPCGAARACDPADLHRRPPAPRRARRTCGVRSVASPGRARQGDPRHPCHWLVLDVAPRGCLGRRARCWATETLRRRATTSTAPSTSGATVTRWPTGTEETRAGTETSELGSLPAADCRRRQALGCRRVARRRLLGDHDVQALVPQGRKLASTGPLRRNPLIALSRRRRTPPAAVSPLTPS
jgi:hypothetical protein